MNARDNELVDNEFSQLKSVAVDVALMKGANRNTLIGGKGSISDLGSDNLAAGFKPIATGAAK